MPRPKGFLGVLPLVPLFAAPLFILGHWAVMPKHFGPGSGGIEAFIYWLTKYPNFGPINWEVGLGILCVMGAHLLPLAFALLWLMPRKRPTRLLLALAAAEVILYVPVLVRLDLESLAAIGALPAILILPSVLVRMSCAIIMPLMAIVALRRVRRPHP